LEDLLRLLLLLVTLFLWWSCQPAAGHDLWIEAGEAGYALYYGHRHSAHEGLEVVEYSPDIVVRADCFDSLGAESDCSVSESYPVQTADSPAALYILTSSGYWTKTPYGTKNLPKNQVEMPVKSWLSFESAKRLGQWSEAFAAPLTDDLEIVPLNDPFCVSPGEKLTLVIMLNGSALESAIVSYDGKPRGTSGRDGKINIRIRHAGFQVIQAAYTVPMDSDEADEVVHTTNLNFELETEE